MPKMLPAATIFAVAVIGIQVFAGEDEIRQAFRQLQVAIKGRDADKVWSLIDQDSQMDAERAAKAVKIAYTKAAAKDKADFEKKYGLGQSAIVRDDWQAVP